jgi:hypothetical protein
LVWARDEFTGEEGFKPVVRLFRNTADTVVHLSYRRDPGSARRGASGLKGGDAEDGDDLSATITGTDEHPFWSLTRDGWIAMGELKPGERLLLADGAATVTGIRIERLETPVTVYNFEVADWHTYYVGSQEAGWVFVHNQCAINPLREVQRNADLAMRAVRRDIAAGRIANTPQAIGQRAHRHFERLNRRLDRRLERTGSKYRVHVEQFVDAGGKVAARNAPGSIGADVVITGGRRTRVYDLKTHGGVIRPMSRTRRADFSDRFDAPVVREIFRQR